VGISLVVIREVTEGEKGNYGDLPRSSMFEQVRPQQVCEYVLVGHIAKQGKDTTARIQELCLRYVEFCMFAGDQPTGGHILRGGATVMPGIMG